MMMKKVRVEVFLIRPEGQDFKAPMPHSSHSLKKARAHTNEDKR